MGTVTIGPLCPVEPCMVTIDQRFSAYSGRKVAVYKPDSRTLAKTVSIKSNGHYEVELEAGGYVVDILPKPTGVGGASGVPKAITIAAGETVTVDIDTGIR